jgi:hypothetical protein
MPYGTKMLVHRHMGCTMISQECPSILESTKVLRTVEGGSFMFDSEDSNEERVLTRAID